jgi:hypothetical protein
MKSARSMRFGNFFWSRFPRISCRRLENALAELNPAVISASSPFSLNREELHSLHSNSLSTSLMSVSGAFCTIVVALRNDMICLFVDSRRDRKSTRTCSRQTPSLTPCLQVYCCSSVHTSHDLRTVEKPRVPVLTPSRSALVSLVMHVTQLTLKDRVGESARLD